MNQTKVYNKVYPRLQQRVLISYLICDVLYLGVMTTTRGDAKSWNRGGGGLSQYTRSDNYLPMHDSKYMKLKSNIPKITSTPGGVERSFINLYKNHGFLLPHRPFCQPNFFPVNRFLFSYLSFLIFPPSNHFLNFSSLI